MQTDADLIRLRLNQADLEAMIAAVDRLSGLLDPVVIASRAADEARRITGMDMIGIAAQEGDRSVAMLGTSGAISDWFTRFRADIDFGQGFMGTIVSTRLPLLFEPGSRPDAIHTFDLDTGAPGDLVLGGHYAAHLAERVAPERLYDYVGVPIEQNNMLIGLLLAGNRSAQANAARGRMLLGRFARMVAPALAAASHAREAAVAQLAAERERIAVDLHDTIGQILFSIGASAKRSARLAEQTDPGISATLKFIEAEASRAGSHLREILRRIGTPPPGVELETELRILAEMFSARCGIAADLIVDGARRQLSHDAFVALVSVVREALHNVEKHSGATTVLVTLHFEPDLASVVIQDDGVGPKPPDKGGLPIGPAGMGLASLQRRLARVGGRLTVRRLEGAGTVVTATLDTGDPR